MGRPFTLLEDLCRHALAHGSQSLAIEHEGRQACIYGRIDDKPVSFVKFDTSSSDARELLDNLHRAHRKPLRTVLDGKVHVLHVHITDSSGEDSFEVSIEPGPKPDPSSPPKFTKKQGEYLAFIHYYTRLHRVAPAESDLQFYFRVSPPSVHEMIKTLERNALIERTPGQARSIRLLVSPEYLPHLT